MSNTTATIVNAAAPRRLVLFGASTLGERAVAALRDRFEIVGFVDNDKTKWGAMWAGRPVYSPDQLAALGADRVIVTSSFSDDIGAQLRQMGIGSFGVFTAEGLFDPVAATVDTVQGKISPSLLRKICDLTRDSFHDGTVVNDVLAEFVRLSETIRLDHTMETGCGRTTLLLSHLSGDHLVFSPGGENMKGLHASGLLNAANVVFHEAPSLQKLPSFHFEHPLDFVLLDGAHGFPFAHVEYFFTYTHLRPGGILVVDDIRIPAVYQLYDFLRYDAMFRLEKIIAKNTAFFVRTNSQTTDPFRECWNKQGFNLKFHPVEVAS